MSHRNEDPLMWLVKVAHEMSATKIDLEREWRHRRGRHVGVPPLGEFFQDANPQSISFGAMRQK